MARNEITFLVNLRKNTNTASKTFGQYYGEAESAEPLGLKGFAKHLAEHGKLATYEMLVLVLQNIVSCMKELICQGQPVKLDGLGTFYPTIEGTGADSVLEYLPAVNIKGVKINFAPEASGYDEDKLTKKQLKAETVFEMNDFVKVLYKTVDGKEVSYQERTPIAQMKIKNAEADPDPEP